LGLYFSCLPFHCAYQGRNPFVTFLPSLSFPCGRWTFPLLTLPGLIFLTVLKHNPLLERGHLPSTRRSPPSSSTFLSDRPNRSPVFSFPESVFLNGPSGQLLTGPCPSLDLYMLTAPPLRLLYFSLPSQNVPPSPKLLTPPPTLTSPTSPLTFVPPSAVGSPSWTHLGPRRKVSFIPPLSIQRHQATTPPPLGMTGARLIPARIFLFVDLSSCCQEGLLYPFRWHFYRDLEPIHRPLFL